MVYLLEIFSDWLVYGLFGLETGSHWSQVFIFFINDTLKILCKKEILKRISREAWGIVWQVLPYIIIGVGVGALIHGFAPTGFFESYLESAGIWGVPLGNFTCHCPKR